MSGREAPARDPAKAAATFSTVVAWAPIPLFGLAGAALTLWVFGLTWLSALGIAFLIGGSAFAAWTLQESTRALREHQRLLDDIRHGSRRRAPHDATLQRRVVVRAAQRTVRRRAGPLLPSLTDGA